MQQSMGSRGIRHDLATEQQLAVPAVAPGIPSPTSVPDEFRSIIVVQFEIHLSQKVSLEFFSSLCTWLLV